MVIKKIKLISITLLYFCLGSVFAQVHSEPIVVNHGLGVYFTQNGKKLTTRKLISITKINPQALKEIQTAKINNEVSQLFGIPGGFLVGLSVGRALVTGEPNMILLGIGAGLVVASIPFSVAYSKHAKNGVNIYNEGLKQTDIGKLDFNLGYTENGIGLKISF